MISSLRSITSTKYIPTIQDRISYGKYQGTAEEIVAEMQSALKQAGIEEVTAALQEQFDALYK